MGVHRRYCVIFCLVSWVFVVNSVSNPAEPGARKSDICSAQSCNCSSKSVWITINCTFDKEQKIELSPEAIPPKTMEVYITGGEEVVFKPQTFSFLQGINRLYVDGTRNFHLPKHSFLDINSASLLVEIENCDRFVVDTGAFKNTPPMTVHVRRCGHVLIKKLAFDRLQEGTFETISFLDLQEGAFTFENQLLTKRHGPVTNLLFQNVIMKIPPAAFSSALADMTIKDSQIRDVHKEAFKANEISAITLINSSIDTIKSGAISGGTLIYNFKLFKCKIRLFETGAVMAGMTNLTVEHSRFTEIQKEAINSTVANVVITDNAFGVMSGEAFVFNDWSRVIIENNIMKNISSFLKVPYNDGALEFTFLSNEIHNFQEGALNFMPQLVSRVQSLKFDNNSFNQTCQCTTEWLEKLIGSPEVSYVLNSSFCIINDLIISRCFNLDPKELINMKNFTEIICGIKDIKCEKYRGQTKKIEQPVPSDDDSKEDKTALKIALILGCVLIVLVISGAIVVGLMRGGVWLKRNGYCMRFRNIKYRQNQPSSEDEEIATERERVELPEELTPELLQALRERLEDPETHDEAREMIERLYETFVVEDSYATNNRQEEEAHLYEELPFPNPPEQVPEIKEPNETIGYLRLMEKKFKVPGGAKPALAGEYSEPNDAAVHLYSELRQNKTDDEEDGKKDSVKSFHTQRSNGSSIMAFRPLPEKPPFESTAGPSTKY